jgi:hypothetical protein
MALPSGIESRPDQSIGLSTSKELPLGGIKVPNVESAGI